jgi:hypothetical protein
MLWLALLFMVSLGGLLLLIGIRGRRLNDHPICRQCAFDLIGVYPSLERCPECGAPLNAPSAIRTGGRRLRTGPLAAGSLLLMVGLVATGMFSAAAIGLYDSKSLKPGWLLLRELRMTGTVDARDELIKRQRNGRLAPTVTRGLIDAALSVHGDPHATWDIIWPAFLEDVWADGLLTREDLGRYAKQTVHIRASAAPRARQGAHAPLHSRVMIDRVIRGPEPIYIRAQTVSASIVGHDPHEGTLRGGIRTQLGPHSGGWGGSTAAVVPDLPPGTYPARLVERLTFHLNSDDDPPFAELEHAADLTIEIVPADTQLITLITDPDIGRELRSTLKLRNTRIASRSQAVKVDGQMRPGYTNLWIEFEPALLPIAIAFDLFVRCGERTVRLGTISARAGRVHFPLQAPQHMLIRDFNCDIVDLILRPSIAAAENSSLDSIWGEEIIFEDVTLDPSPPGNSPGGA